MTTCETLTHGTRVFLSRRHRFGTDGMLLADFCRPRRDELAADLCGGCGIVALRWHDEGCDFQRPLAGCDVGWR